MPGTASDRWRRSRRTIRLRLAMMYGALFLISGVALLGITYGLFAGGIDGRNIVFVATQNGVSTNPPPPKVPLPQEAESMRHLAEEQASAQHAEAKRQLLIV